MSRVAIQCYAPNNENRERGHVVAVPLHVEGTVFCLRRERLPFPAQTRQQFVVFVAINTVGKVRIFIRLAVTRRDE